MTRSYFRRADGVMLLYDVTSDRSFMSVRQWIEAVDVSITHVPLLLTVASIGRDVADVQPGPTVYVRVVFSPPINISSLQPMSSLARARVISNLCISPQDVAEKRIPIMLCANKVDLRMDACASGRRCISTEEGQKMGREHSAIFIETSAKDGKNVFDALVQLAR